MMLVIRTQYLENYGAHDWDGTGECPQHWKAKGGLEYKVINVPANIDHQVVVDMVGVEQSNNHCRERVTDWSLEADDYLSEYERSQLEFDGHIEFHEETVDYSDIKNIHDANYAEWSADLDAEYYGEHV